MSKKREGKPRPWGSVVHRPDRGGRYYVEVQHGGVRYRKAAGRTWGEADKKRRALRTLVESGIPMHEAVGSVFSGRTPGGGTFEALAPAYLAFASTRKRPSTLEADTRRLGVLLAAPWAKRPLVTVTKADVLRWLDMRRKPREIERRRKRRPGETLGAYRKAKDKREKVMRPGAGPATLNRDLSLASALFAWATDAGHLPEDAPNPFRMVRRYKEPKGRDVFLTAEESAALVAEASDVLRPVLVLALSTGMRRGELLALAWRAVDLDRATLYVEPATAKSGKGRTVPLTAEARSALEDLKARRTRPSLDGTDPVLLLPDGSPLTTKILRTMYEGTVARCDGIPASKRGSVTFHTLRHTYASLAAQAGVPLHALQGLLGHGSARMLARYTHHDPARLADALAPFEKAVHLLGPKAPQKRAADGA